MSDTLAEMMQSVDQSQEQTLGVMENIFSAAQARAVFSEPVQAGDYTVITASEVMAGGGFGIGRGLGSSPAPAMGPDATAESGTASGGGGGGGGGGGSRGRPVAAIVIGPNGVQVRPIVDVSKIAIAAITTWAAMLPFLLRMRRPTRS